MPQVNEQDEPSSRSNVFVVAIEVLNMKALQEDADIDEVFPKW